MVIADGQEFLLTCGKPLLTRVAQALRAMPIATRVEGDGVMSASGAPIEMPAQRGSSTPCDRPQHTEMLRGEPGPVHLNEAIAVLANDVGHLEGWPGHRFCRR